jgi:hypothetical protein
MRPDLRKRLVHIDMQKIMMAVLVAMQDERDRQEADAAEADSPAETPI